MGCSLSKSVAHGENPVALDQTAIAATTFGGQSLPSNLNPASTNKANEGKAASAAAINQLQLTQVACTQATTTIDSSENFENQASNLISTESYPAALPSLIPRPPPPTADEVAAAVATVHAELQAGLPPSRSSRSDFHSETGGVTSRIPQPRWQQDQTADADESCSGTGGRNSTPRSLPPITWRSGASRSEAGSCVGTGTPTSRAHARGASTFLMGEEAASLTAQLHLRPATGAGDTALPLPLPAPDGRLPVLTRAPLNAAKPTPATGAAPYGRHSRGVSGAHTQKPGVETEAGVGGKRTSGAFSTPAGTGIRPVPASVPGRVNQTGADAATQSPQAKPGRASTPRREQRTADVVAAAVGMDGGSSDDCGAECAGEASTGSDALSPSSAVSAPPAQVSRAGARGRFRAGPTRRGSLPGGPGSRTVGVHSGALSPASGGGGGGSHTRGGSRASVESWRGEATARLPSVLGEPGTPTSKRRTAPHQGRASLSGVPGFKITMGYGPGEGGPLSAAIQGAASSDAVSGSDESGGGAEGAPHDGAESHAFEPAVLVMMLTSYEQGDSSCAGGDGAAGGAHAPADCSHAGALGDLSCVQAEPAGEGAEVAQTQEACQPSGGRDEDGIAGRGPIVCDTGPPRSPIASGATANPNTVASNTVDQFKTPSCVSGSRRRSRADIQAQSVEGEARAPQFSL